jgi:RND family efflux transporter MFP subunit
MEEELVSEQEVEQQQLKVKQSKSRLAKLELELDLTRRYLHPSQIEKAEARLASAKQELNIARAQLNACTVTAPSDGIVVYRPIHVGGEYRSVRVGDSIYKNQPFMYIPDMSDLVVNCYVPEAELSRVNEGGECLITSLAYPDMTLTGQVETIGFMAQNKPGQKNWQKYFRVVVALKSVDERLRTDMSVQTRICSYRNDRALLIPRKAVRWDKGVPYCRVKMGHRVERRSLKLGRADRTDYEVLAGVAEGDRVVVQ